MKKNKSLISHSAKEPGKDSAKASTGSTGASMARALTREESYVNGKLTRPALVSISILTFITFVGNFTPPANGSHPCSSWSWA